MTCYWIGKRKRKRLGRRWFIIAGSDPTTTTANRLRRCPLDATRPVQSGRYRCPSRPRIFAPLRRNNSGAVVGRVSASLCADLSLVAVGNPATHIPSSSSWSRKQGPPSRPSRTWMPHRRRSGVGTCWWWPRPS